MIHAEMIDNVRYNYDNAVGMGHEYNAEDAHEVEAGRGCICAGPWPWP